MTSQEAKQILARYRPEAPNEDPDVLAALDLARRDPQLQEWLEEALAVQRALRAKFRSIQPPPAFADDLIAAYRRKAMPWRPAPVWLAAAAVVILSATLLIFWTRQPSEAPMAQYRARMVGSALRQYDIELRTNSLDAVRKFVADRNAPADFTVPSPLRNLPLTGAGVLSWQGHPVSMVCFDRGDSNMLYLFVIDRKAVGDAPAAGPAELIKVSKLMTANWTDGDRTYVLAGDADPASLRAYTGAP